MLIKHFVVGPIETNCYLVTCQKTLEAIVIDPDIRVKEEEEKLFGEISKQKLKVKYIVNSHYHPDHIGGNGILKKATGAEILVHELDAPLLPEPWRKLLELIRLHKDHPCLACGYEKISLDVQKEQRKAYMKCSACGLVVEMPASPPADRLLHHGDVIRFGLLELNVIHTPGHSPGGICLYIEKEKAVFTGDTLFSGSVGRTDLGDGSMEDILKSVSELAKLPEDTIVYPGHGEKTTIGKEKCENPYLQDTQSTVEDR